MERVARVLAAEADGLPPLTDDDWVVYFREDEREDWRALARAAVAALRGDEGEAR